MMLLLGYSLLRRSHDSVLDQAVPPGRASLNIMTVYVRVEQSESEE